jgi:hypothetical protein
VTRNWIRWIIPTRDDPRNVSCAKAAGPLVMLQWLVLVLAMLMTPMDYRTPWTATGDAIFFATLVGVSLSLL